MSSANNNMKNFNKNIVLWIIIGLLLIALFNLFQGGTNNRSASQISFSDFLAELPLQKTIYLYSFHSSLQSIVFKVNKEVLAPVANTSYGF